MVFSRKINASLFAPISDLPEVFGPFYPVSGQTWGTETPVVFLNSSDKTTGVTTPSNRVLTHSGLQLLVSYKPANMVALVSL